MNFQDLYKKIHAISEGVDTPVEECGMMPMPGMMSSPKQSDSVSMSVNMNASGAGGIKELMGILRNIEQGSTAPAQHHHDADTLFGGEPDGQEIIIGDMEEEMNDGGFGSATTSPEQHIAGIDAVTPTGDDLASKGGNEVEKVNGGGNPYAVKESLVARLASHYQSIKEGQGRLQD
jgi:hypothetical protein